MSDPHNPEDQRDPTQSPDEVVEQPRAPQTLADPARRARVNLLRDVLVPLLAIFTSVLIGAVIVFFTAPEGRGSRLEVTWNAFLGLFVGAFGNWTDPATIPAALSGTLVESTPYILAGLAVAIGFKAGLFNIGAEGQLILGALGSVVVAVWLPGWLGVESLPAIIHLPAAILGGIIAGGIWGAIPGYLRAQTGAHEVITTIMLNYIALRLLSYLTSNGGPMQDPAASAPRTPFIQGPAILPQFIGQTRDPSLTGGNTYQPFFETTSSVWDLRLHAGLLIALLAVVFVWWLLNRTPTGFEIRTVGANPVAAEYAGMSIVRTVVLTMFLSGALAGLAGTSQVLGLERNMKSVFSGGLGFDSIAIALLAKSNPIAIIPAAFFWGALRAGAATMQLYTGISINLVNIIQALVIMFIAADQIIRWMYRLRGEEGQQMVFTRGWGK